MLIGMPLPHRCRAALATLLIMTSVSSFALGARADDGPVDRHATRITREFLRRLRRAEGRFLWSGQTDLPDAEYVHDQTGKSPAILGLDFMSTPRSMGGDRSNTQTAIDWTLKRGGIVTFQWHWSSPIAPKDKGKAFYTGQSGIDIEAVLRDPASADYQALLRDIDDVAAELKAMQDAGVSVLFRPLHEAQGRWFWWGEKGPEPCRRLYRLIFDRITQVHHVHNVLWVWNVYPASQGKGDPAAWYPGNDCVDIVATDYLQSKADYDALRALTQGKKPAAIAETMNPPDPAEMLRQGANWLYWVMWAKRDWNKSSLDDLKKAIQQPQSRNLAEYP